MAYYGVSQHMAHRPHIANGGLACHPRKLPLSNNNCGTFWSLRSL